MNIEYTHTHTKVKGNLGKYVGGGMWGIRVNTEESRKAGHLF